MNIINIPTSEQNKIYKLRARIKYLIETRDLYILENRKRDAQAVEYMAVECGELIDKIKRGQFVSWDEINTKDEKER